MEMYSSNVLNSGSGGSNSMGGLNSSGIYDYPAETTSSQPSKSALDAMPSGFANTASSSSSTPSTASTAPANSIIAPIISESMRIELLKVN